MQVIKFAIVALLVCFFVAAVFGQGSRGGQDYETAAITGTSGQTAHSLAAGKAKANILAAYQNAV
jgi:ABC-type transporter Mla subunit MlaD